MMKKARQVQAKRKTLNCDIAGAIGSLKLKGERNIQNHFTRLKIKVRYFNNPQFKLNNFVYVKQKKRNKIR